MDNKKWYNRFATIFWWGLTILPLIIALIYFIGFHLTFNSGITSANELVSYHNSPSGEFGYYLDLVLLDGEYLTFDGLSLTFINTMYDDLFQILHITFAGTLSLLFGWMTSVQFYHLIFDFIVWLPRWCHNILSKGVDKVD